MTGLQQHQSDPVGTMLAARVATMRGYGDSAPATRLADELESIRKLALANGYASVLPVVHALDHVLARRHRSAPIAGWLSILDDAVGCGAANPRAEAAFAALCSVRLGC